MVGAATRTGENMLTHVKSAVLFAGIGIAFMGATLPAEDASALPCYFVCGDEGSGGGGPGGGGGLDGYGSCPGGLTCSSCKKTGVPGTYKCCDQCGTCITYSCD